MLCVGLRVAPDSRWLEFPAILSDPWISFRLLLLGEISGLVMLLHLLLYSGHLHDIKLHE